MTKKVEVSEIQGPLTELMDQIGGANGRQRLTEFKMWLKGVTFGIIQIVRGRFNPMKFIGHGWSIQSDETDARSIALTELDPTKVQFVTMLKDGETYVKGEEKLKRLKSAGLVRLDADIFLTLWENQHLIPESWKEKVNGNTRYIFFDGTVLRDSVGDRCFLYLYWDGGAWDWSVLWLDFGWRDDDPSAVLAS